MKYFVLLLTSLIVITLSGCKYVNVMPETSTYTQVSSKTTLNKTSLNIGEDLIIDTELEYTGNNSVIDGFPMVWITRGPSENVQAWYLTQNGITVPFGQPESFSIKKGEKFKMTITWDMKINGLGLPSGDYQIMTTIATYESSNVRRMLISNHMVLPFTVTNDSGEQALIPFTPTINIQDHTEVLVTPTISVQNSPEVLVTTIFNKNSLTIGENLDIQAEMTYVGSEPTILAVPFISITGESGTIYAQWTLDKDGEVIVSDVLEWYKNPYEIQKEKKYVMHVTWDLSKTYVTHIKDYAPSGEYNIKITFATPYDSGYHPLTSDEGPYTITITNDNPDLVLITNTDIISNTHFNKTSFIRGENISIQSEVQYVGSESSIIGVPMILVTDTNHQCLGIWFVNQQGIVSSQNEMPTNAYFTIEKDKKYILDIMWDFKRTYPDEYVPEGSYSIQITIASPYLQGFTTPLSSEGFLNISFVNSD